MYNNSNIPVKDQITNPITLEDIKNWNEYINFINYITQNKPDIGKIEVDFVGEKMSSGEKTTLTALCALVTQGNIDALNQLLLELMRLEQSSVDDLVLSGHISNFKSKLQQLKRTQLEGILISMTDFNQFPLAEKTYHFVPKPEEIDDIYGKELNSTGKHILTQLHNLNQFKTSSPANPQQENDQQPQYTINTHNRNVNLYFAEQIIIEKHKDNSDPKHRNETVLPKLSTNSTRAKARVEQDEAQVPHNTQLQIYRQKLTTDFERLVQYREAIKSRSANDNRKGYVNELISLMREAINDPTKQSELLNKCSDVEKSIQLEKTLFGLVKKSNFLGLDINKSDLLKITTEIRERLQAFNNTYILHEPKSNETYAQSLKEIIDDGAKNNDTVVTLCGKGTEKVYVLKLLNSEKKDVGKLHLLLRQLASPKANLSADEIKEIKSNLEIVKKRITDKYPGWQNIIKVAVESLEELVNYQMHDHKGQKREDAVKEIIPLLLTVIEGESPLALLKKLKDVKKSLDDENRLSFSKRLQIFTNNTIEKFQRAMFSKLVNIVTGQMAQLSDLEQKIFTLKEAVDLEILCGVESEYRDTSGKRQSTVIHIRKAIIDYLIFPKPPLIITEKHFDFVKNLLSKNQEFADLLWGLKCRMLLQEINDLNKGANRRPLLLKIHQHLSAAVTSNSTLINAMKTRLINIQQDWQKNNKSFLQKVTEDKSINNEIIQKATKDFMGDNAGNFLSENFKLVFRIDKGDETLEFVNKLIEGEATEQDAENLTVAKNFELVFGKDRPFVIALANTLIRESEVSDLPSWHKRSQFLLTIIPQDDDTKEVATKLANLNEFVAAIENIIDLSNNKIDNDILFKALLDKFVKKYDLDILYDWIKSFFVKSNFDTAVSLKLLNSGLLNTLYQKWKQHFQVYEDVVIPKFEYFEPINAIFSQSTLAELEINVKLLSSELIQDLIKIKPDLKEQITKNLDDKVNAAIDSLTTCKDAHELNSIQKSVLAIVTATSEFLSDEQITAIKSKFESKIDNLIRNWFKNLAIADLRTLPDLIIKLKEVRNFTDDSLVKGRFAANINELEKEATSLLTEQVIKFIEYWFKNLKIEANTIEVAAELSQQITDFLDNGVIKYYVSNTQIKDKIKAILNAKSEDILVRAWELQIQENDLKDINFSALISPKSLLGPFDLLGAEKYPLNYCAKAIKIVRDFIEDPSLEKEDDLDKDFYFASPNSITAIKNEQLFQEKSIRALKILQKFSETMTNCVNKKEIIKELGFKKEKFNNLFKSLLRSTIATQNNNLLNKLINGEFSFEYEGKNYGTKKFIARMLFDEIIASQVMEGKQYFEQEYTLSHLVQYLDFNEIAEDVVEEFPHLLHLILNYGSEQQQTSLHRFMLTKLTDANYVDMYEVAMYEKYVTNKGTFDFREIFINLKQAQPAVTPELFNTFVDRRAPQPFTAMLVAGVSMDPEQKFYHICESILDRQVQQQFIKEFWSLTARRDAEVRNFIGSLQIERNDPDYLFLTELMKANSIENADIEEFLGMNLGHSELEKKQIQSIRLIHQTIIKTSEQVANTSERTAAQFRFSMGTATQPKVVPKHLSKAELELLQKQNYVITLLEAGKIADAKWEIGCLIVWGKNNSDKNWEEAKRTQFSPFLAKFADHLVLKENETIESYRTRIATIEGSNILDLVSQINGSFRANIYEPINRGLKFVDIVESLLTTINKLNELGDRQNNTIIANEILANSILSINNFITILNKTPENQSILFTRFMKDEFVWLLAGYQDVFPWARFILTAIESLGMTLNGEIASKKFKVLTKDLKAQLINELEQVKVLMPLLARVSNNQADVNQLGKINDELNNKINSNIIDADFKYLSLIRKNTLTDANLGYFCHISSKQDKEKLSNTLFLLVNKLFSNVIDEESNDNSLTNISVQLKDIIQLLKALNSEQAIISNLVDLHKTYGSMSSKADQIKTLYYQLCKSLGNEKQKQPGFTEWKQHISSTSEKLAEAIKDSFENETITKFFIKIVFDFQNDSTIRTFDEWQLLHDKDRSIINELTKKCSNSKLAEFKALVILVTKLESLPSIIDKMNTDVDIRKQLILVNKEIENCQKISKLQLLNKVKICFNNLAFVMDSPNDNLSSESSDNDEFDNNVPNSIKPSSSTDSFELPKYHKDYSQEGFSGSSNSSENSSDDEDSFHSTPTLGS